MRGRLFRVEVTVDGKTFVYTEGLSLSLKGSKLADSQLGKAELTLTNIPANELQAILQNSMPFSGRMSYPSVNVFVGINATGTEHFYTGLGFVGNVTAPPDRKLTLSCNVGGMYHSNTYSLGGQPTLHDVIQAHAARNNLQAVLQAPNKNLGSYTFTGSGVQAVSHLNTLKRHDEVIYQDKNQIIYTRRGEPRKGGAGQPVLEDGDIIGQPEISVNGMTIKFWWRNGVQLGGGLQVKSDRFPELNGEWWIFKLDYELTSRDEAFYYEAHCGIRR